MENTLKVQISLDQASYIESLDFEQSARKDIISFMLEKNMNVSTEAFKKYQKEQSEFYASFQTAKQALEQEHMPEEWRNHQVNWNLDYHTGVMTLEKICNC